MYEGWFAGWFGGWFSDWFGGGSEVPVPPVTIGGGHAPELKQEQQQKRRERERLQISIHALQGQPTATIEIQATAEVLVFACQAPARAAALVEYERPAVALPPVRRKEAEAFVPRSTPDTIGAFIPRPRPPIQHPPLRAPTRPQRQEARRRIRTILAKTSDKEAIVKAIENLL